MLPDNSSTDGLALEVVLSSAWPDAFQGTSYLSTDTLEQLLKALLVEASPHSGEIERASIRLRALDSDSR